jgi:hypothetical protein
VPGLSGANPGTTNLRSDAVRAGSQVIIFTCQTANVMPPGLAHPAPAQRISLLLRVLPVSFFFSSFLIFSLPAAVSAANSKLSLRPAPMKGWAERREARIFKSRLRGAIVHAYEARRAPDLGPAALASRRSNLALRGGPRFRLASVRASYLSPATATGQNLAF